MSYKRNTNLKELSARSSPYKNNKNRNNEENMGCFKCEATRCDYCSNFLETGTTFRSAATEKMFKICKSLTCTSVSVIYLAQCVQARSQLDNWGGGLYSYIRVHRL